MSWKLLPVAPLPLVRANPAPPQAGPNWARSHSHTPSGFLTPAWHVSALNGGPRPALEDRCGRYLA